MPRYVPGIIPSGGVSLEQVLEILQRELQAVAEASDRAEEVELQVLNVEPSKRNAGMLVYADGSNWNPGFGEGVYRRNAANTAWVPIGLNESIGTGTFTPELSFGGASTGITYASRNAQWTRLGDRLFLDIRLILTSKGTATGTAQVSTLPFTLAGNVSLVTRLDRMTAGVGDTVYCNVGSGSTFGFQKIASGNFASLTDVDFTNTSDILLAGMVRI